MKTYFQLFNNNIDIFILNLKEHTEKVSCVCITENYYISGSYDNTVRIWNKLNMKCLHILKDYENKVDSLLFNDNFIISASLLSNKILIWNIKNATAVKIL